MNRTWLQEQIKSYLHDSTVDAQLDTWIDIAAGRVSQGLRCWEMEQELVRAAGSAENYIDLGTTTRQILGVQWQNNSGAYTNLQSVPRHDAGLYKRNGQPCVYLVEDRKVWPLPMIDGNYKAQVIQDVVIPAGLETTPALTAYPFLFLNAALAEAYDWKQDPEMMARMEQKWQSEADMITKTYLSERVGDTPAMRAV